MAKLTVRAIEAAKPKAKWYTVTVDRDLYLRVSPFGEKVWLVRYVIGGKQIQARLPKPYGNAGEGFMTLAQAGAENARIQALARDGIDFQQQRAEADRVKAETSAAAEAAALAASRSVEEMFNAWLADGVSRKDGNAELRRSFGKDVLPVIGSKPVKQVTEHDLRTLLRAIVARGANPTAVRIYRGLVQLFAWAEKRQPWRGLMIEGNPVGLLDITKIVASDFEVDEERARILSEFELRELRDIFVRMETDYENAANKRSTVRPLKRTSQLALWISLSTTCRIGELLMAEWRHIDLDRGEWFIPKENVKGARGKKQDHRVFMSDFTRRQFESLRGITSDSKWCFPARNETVGDAHVYVKAVSKQVGDRQTQFKDRKPLKNRKNDNTLVLAKGQHGDWTPHDMRRTGATLMQKLGVSLDVIDRCQNHILAGSKVRRAYMHHDYADETREAWRRLGDRLDAILTIDNVVPFERKAA